LAEALKIREITAMCLRTGGGEQLGARIRARETEHLMACTDQFLNYCGTHEACSACNKYFHKFSFFSCCVIDRQIAPPT
jgi:hypothetical protein